MQGRKASGGIVSLGKDSILVVVTTSYESELFCINVSEPNRDNRDSGVAVG